MLLNGIVATLVIFWSAVSVKKLPLAFGLMFFNFTLPNRFVSKFVAPKLVCPAELLPKVLKAPTSVDNPKLVINVPPVVGSVYDNVDFLTKPPALYNKILPFVASLVFCNLISQITDYLYLFFLMKQLNQHLFQNR